MYIALMIVPVFAAWSEVFIEPGTLLAVRQRNQRAILGIYGI